ncbi:PQQ-binding-like beta-propeller repeat protein [Gordonia sp. CPCC 206044]|uniref:hypothetical protein n=1 Tax=Gordonia sp. CPCC 206044 TaxID=3140793 RepID=UPI003AF37093
MRGRWGAGAFLAALLVLIAVMVVVVVSVPRSVDGLARAPESPAVHPGEDPAIEPIATEPTSRWKVDAKALFGAAASPKYLMVKAASDDLVVVSGLPAGQTPSPVAAISPDDGHPLWEHPSTFAAKQCALSRDGALACVRNGDSGTDSTLVAFLDADTGEVRTTKTVTTPGYANIVRAGDGFLVYTENFSGGLQKTTALTWFDSAAARTWTRTPPPELEYPELSEAGNVVAIADHRSGARVYALDSGVELYDSTRDFRAASATTSYGPPTVSVAPNAAGFAVSYSTIGGKSAGDRLLLFDRLGIRRNQIDGFRLTLRPDGTEGERIPVEREDEKSSADFAGVFSMTQGRVLWEQPSDYTHDVSLVSGKLLSMRSSAADREGYQWKLFDGATGEPRATVAASIYMDLEAFDGDRVVFEGDMRAGEPGPGAYTAFDAASGQQVWRVKTRQSADDVNLRIVGPYFFRYDAQVGRSVASITRLG